MNKSELSTNELIMLQSEMTRNEKSAGLAYMMLLGGHLGVHRFYLKRFVTGSIQLGLFICFFISYIFLGVTNSTDNGSISYNDFSWLPLIFMAIFGLSLLIWIIVDACLIGRYIKEWNKEIETKTIAEIISYRQTT
jgi:TM2 domain-containing membrane protein YozV